MNHAIDMQVQRNLSTRDCWKTYATHRSTVTELLVRAGHAADDAICVLGAGNCNDVDLSVLEDSFAEIQLVDLDGEALNEGVERQSLKDPSKIQKQGGCDITGVMDLMATWSAETGPAQNELDACLDKLTQIPELKHSGRFDVVASVCLLTQLFDSVVGTLGESHPRFVEFVVQLRTQHLQLFLNLLRPGGRGVLITDVVSSTTLPVLFEITQQELAPTLAGAINNGNFFTGTNPAVLEALLRTDPQLSASVAGVRVSMPWRWQVLNKVFAVFAIEATKTG